MQTLCKIGNANYRLHIPPKKKQYYKLDLSEQNTAASTRNIDKCIFISPALQIRTQQTHVRCLCS